MVQTSCKDEIHTRNENVLVVSDEVLDDLLRAVDDIDVSPVHPGVVGLQSRVEKVVAGSTNGLATGTLGGKGVPVLDVHVDDCSKVLLDNRRAAECDLLLRLLLDALQLRREHGKGVIGAVANQEGQIDKLVRVGQFGDEVEVLGEVGGRVSQRSQDEHLLAVGNGLGGRLDGIQIVGGDRAGIDFVRLVVVEDDGCLEMSVPLDHLIDRHLHRRLGGAIAVEAIICTAAVSISSFHQSCKSFRQLENMWNRTTYFCISAADLLIPRHSRIIRPVTATEMRNRGRVRRTTTALHGGNLAFADFHVTPPLGSSIFAGVSGSMLQMEGRCR